MGLEEIPTATEDQTNPENPPNPNPRTPGGAVDEDTEEGEIVGEEDSSINKSAEIPLQPHQLEHSWTFWFDNLSAKSKHTAWGHSMRSIYTFATIEEFWRNKLLGAGGTQWNLLRKLIKFMYAYHRLWHLMSSSVFNNIRQPSQLAVGTDLYCFKHKIEPKWEDPVCSNGGDWTAAFSKGRSDKCWLYTLLAMIGEQFNHGDEICGAVVNVRARQERISLWTKNASNEAAQLSIGKQWKKFIDYDENIGFIFHEDAKILEKNAKSKYTI